MAGLLLMLLVSGSLGAVERIQVEALFSGKAMVRIDGTRRLLKQGKASPEGVVLISADSRAAVLEVDGRCRSYRLGSHVSTSFSSPEQVSAKIWRDRSGGYSTVGSINGRTVDFLVDTGASAVAMPASQAHRLGIPYRLEGKRIQVGTANGVATAYEVTLDRVRVGDITLNRVRGFVIESEAEGKTLLGMSFLGRVRMENRGEVLLLRKKF